MDASQRIPRKLSVSLSLSLISPLKRIGRERGKEGISAISGAVEEGRREGRKEADDIPSGPELLSHGPPLRPPTSKCAAPYRVPYCRPPKVGANVDTAKLKEDKKGVKECAVATPAAPFIGLGSSPLSGRVSSCWKRNSRNRSPLLHRHFCPAPSSSAVRCNRCIVLSPSRYDPCSVKQLTS